MFNLFISLFFIFLFSIFILCLLQENLQNQPITLDYETKNVLICTCDSFSFSMEPSK